MYFKDYLQIQCLFARHHRKIKRNQPKPQKKNVDLHKSGSSLGAISKHLKVQRSSVRTIVRKCMGPSSRHTAQEGDAFCLLEINILWCEKCKSTPEQQMLEETGPKLSTSTVKRALYRHNLKGHSARKKPLLQNRHKKARRRFATAHGDKDHTFWRNVLWSELFGHNDHRYFWRKKGEACKPKNTIPTVKHGGGSNML